MSLSNATVSPTNIPLTPMRVTWNGVDMGATVEGVTIQVKYETADIMLDQWGKTPADKKVSGHAYSVKTTFAEIKNKATVKVALPSAHQVGTGPYSIYADMQIGDSLLAKAQVLILHPLEAADNDLSEDWKFFKAVAMEATEVKYGPDKQSGMSVEFVIFPDVTTTPARFFIYGDPTIGVVNASAGSATAGSNTGTGTIGTISTTNAGAKTETITILCIGIGGSTSNEFSVVGSVSGILGVFNLAHTSSSTATFTAPGGQIAFTANQASTAFIVGDSFTIPVTAANFA